VSWQTSLLTAKDAVKDVALTALGGYAIWSQIFRNNPNGLVIGAGLALTVPKIAGHVRALLPSPGDGDSLPSTPQPQLLPSPVSAEETSDGDE
jgi:hypothetical protein